MKSLCLEDYGYDFEEMVVDGMQEGKYKMFGSGEEAIVVKIGEQDILINTYQGEEMLFVFKDNQEAIDWLEEINLEVSMEGDQEVSKEVEKAIEWLKVNH